MKLTRVSITGADDLIDPEYLIDLSLEFPFVEWAILVSRSQENNYRFPSRTWCRRFAALVNAANLTKGTSINVATHVCGSWVRELLVGDLRWDDLPDVLDVSKRVQINTYSEMNPHNYRRFLANLRDLPNKEFIFQLDGVNNYLVLETVWEISIQGAGLFDTSAGAGILPARWPTILHPYSCGFAGGLGPENVVEQIAAIEAANSSDYLTHRTYWIDMERRVRSEDDSYFDLTKVRRVLDLAKPFITEV